MAQPNQLIITIEDGNCRVEGPIHEKAFCYMALELAKDAIRDYNGQQTAKASPLIAAPPGLRIT